MKSIYMTVVKEFKLIFRDGITLYLTISPAVLALIFIFVFGSVQNASIGLVVDPSVSPVMTEKLAAVADLEYVNSFDQLEKRVKGVDSIAGVYQQDGTLKLLFEGNEAQGFAQSRSSLVSAALNVEPLEYEPETVEAQSSLAYSISMACIFLLALFIGGATLGISGVNERESGAIRAVSISPMSLFGYSVSKITPALLLGGLGVSICTLMIGDVSAMPRFLLLALCSVFVTGVVVFLMITFADNQIAAVGVLKIIMPLFLVVGVSSVFIPTRWLFIYYLLPMYWQYAAIDAIITGGAAALPLLMTLGTGLVWFVVVMNIFHKKIKIKAWR